MHREQGFGGPYQRPRVWSKGGPARAAPVQSAEAALVGKTRFVYEGVGGACGRFAHGTPMEDGESVNEMKDAPTSPPGTSPGAPVLFRAFQERKGTRSGWGFLAVLALGLLLWWLVHQQVTPPPRPRSAARGLQAVKQGMTPDEVSGLLGHPFASRTTHGGECLQYGHPTMQKASFPVYSACYEGGKLLQVTVKHYTALPLGPDGMPLAPPPGDTARPDTPLPETAKAPAPDAGSP